MKRKKRNSATGNRRIKRELEKPYGLQLARDTECMKILIIIGPMRSAAQGNLNEIRKKIGGERELITI